MDAERSEKQVLQGAGKGRQPPRFDDDRAFSRRGLEADIDRAVIRRCSNSGTYRRLDRSEVPAVNYACEGKLL